MREDRSFALSIHDLAFGAALAYIIGVFVASIGRSLSFVAWLFIVLLIGGIFAINKFFEAVISWKTIITCICIFLAGILYYGWYLARYEAAFTEPFNKETAMVGLVTEDSRETGKYEIFTLEPWHSNATMILAPPGSALQYGDFVDLFGIMYAPDASGDEPFFLASKVSLIAHERGSWLRDELEDVKQGIVVIYNRYLSQDEAALLAGVTFGGSPRMSFEMRSAMTLSGTSYILSMYGYKIAFVIALAMVMLERLLLPRKLSLLVCIALVIAFVMMAGISAAAVRAGIMAIISLLAQETGRSVDKRNAIALTAGAMLVWDPLLLMHDIGFQLSCLSVIGITYLQAPIKQWWKYEGAGIFGWKDATVTTFAVLAPMVPLIGDADGRFALTAIPSNVLMFFTMPLTVALGLILAFVGTLFSPAGFFVAEIGAPILQFQMVIIKIFSQYAIFTPFSFQNPLIAVIYYSALGIFMYHYRENR